MPISWNEIRHNAVGFSRRWAAATSETAEKQTFWNEFFQVFGLQRRLVATFEEPVRRITGQYGHIDLFWMTCSGSAPCWPNTRAPARTSAKLSPKPSNTFRTSS